MPSIGRIPVPEIVPSELFFPLKPDLRSGVSIEPEVKTFQFGSGNAKIEQRFVLGNGTRKFSVRRAVMSNIELGQLADFWELNHGAVGAFKFAAPDGNTYTVRFADPKISWEYLTDCVTSTGVVLQEVPAVAAPLPLNATVERFPTWSLSNSLLGNVQTIIPLIRIRVLDPAVPDILISDRQVQVGSSVYQPRLTSWDGIQQTANMDLRGDADKAVFTFGNADRVFTKVANDCSLWLAKIEFSLYHLETGTKIDLWAGHIQDWNFNSGPEFKVTAYDSIYELTLPYPTRKVSRTCYKIFKAANCPYSGGETSCDKSWASCKARGMENYFGGIIGLPQSVRTKDNSTGVWGYGRNSMQSSSVVSDSVYSEILPDIWYDDPFHPLAVNAKILEGRDEGDFYAALGIVGRGPLGAYTPHVYNDQSPFYIDNPVPVWHTLDGRPSHGPGKMGLRQSLGHDPVRDNDPDHNSHLFSLGEGGDGIQTYTDIKAAGVAFVELRRNDEKGLQLEPIASHQMRAYVEQGLTGLVWTGPGQRTSVPGCNNPIWVALNCLLMAKGLWTEDPAFIAQQEALFDVTQAIAAAAVCNELVAPIVARSWKSWINDGNDNGHWEDVPITEEKQFTFNGAMVEQKPLRQWIIEILANCLGYYTFSFGKIRFGVRFHSGAQSAFTIGNIVFNSLEVSAVRPEFNRFTATFGDVDFDFAADSVSISDTDQAQFIGGPTSPVFLDANTSLSGTITRSQAARIVTARLREEAGGITLAEQKKARKLAYKTTILALDVHPGMVCALDHEDMPGGSGEFRILSWKLNPDYSIDIEGRTTTDSMYNMLVGNKPNDVKSEPIPTETVFKPAEIGFRLDVPGDGTVSIADLFCGKYGSTVHQGIFDIYHVPEDQSALLTLTEWMTAETDTFKYIGAVAPKVREWVLIDGEVMEVLTVTPTEPYDRTGTCTVKRGQLGTEAVAHHRLGPLAISNISADNQSFDIAGEFYPGNGIADDISGEWSIIGSYENGRMTALWPFVDLTGEGIYSNPNIYRVVKKSVVIPFAPRFFTSPDRAGFKHQLNLSNAGIVAAVAVLTNTRGDKSEPKIITYTSSFPFRVRTGGNATITLTHPVPEQGLTENAFHPVVIPSGQACRSAKAEWKDLLYLPTPSAIGTVDGGAVQPGGTITVSVSNILSEGSIQVSIGEPGDANYISVPAMSTSHLQTPAFVADALCTWLNNNKEFFAFFWARNAAASNIITITDKTGRGGKLIVQAEGQVSAVATGMLTPMGVKTGRKYAATFSDGTHESNLSALSVSSGPTGGASEIHLKDLPSTGREDITDVFIYASPDGLEGPLYRVGSVPIGTTQFTDEVFEEDLAALPKFTGANQPAQDGGCTITVKRDGNRWFVLQIQGGKSTSIHGLALGGLPEGTVITADVENSLAEGELTVQLD